MMDGMKRLALTVLAAVIALPLAADPPRTVAPESAPTWSSGTYVYDPSGNIVKVGAERYTYDLLSRLKTGTAGPGHTQAYGYDPFGNITSIVTDGGAALVPGVDQATNRISSMAGSNAFGTYDGAGNMITYLGLYTYIYDAANMVKETTGPSSQHEVYLYTVDDERVAAGTVTGSGGGATITSYRYTIRGLDNKVLRELDDTISGGTHTWTWKEDYIYANGQLQAAETPSRTLHFFSDHLGTPRLITDGAYNQVARHDYYPYGQEATSSAQDGEVMKFTGHERDTTLDYMHARYYTGPVGRFLSTDPISTPLGAVHRPQKWDRYAYVRNDPLGSRDPTGLYECRGSKEACDSIAISLKIMKFAAAQMSLVEGRTQLEKVLKAFGSAGDATTQISNVWADPRNADGTPLLARNVLGQAGKDGNLFVSLVNIGAKVGNDPRNVATAFTILAGTLTHEGDHEVEPGDMSGGHPSLLSLLYHENHAYSLEKAFYRHSDFPALAPDPIAGAWASATQACIQMGCVP